MAKGKKTGGKDWQKGQSGNPNGRPKKEDTYSDILRRVMDEIDPDTELTYKERLALALRELAITEKYFPAMREIQDRLVGKPQQSLEVTGNIQFPEVVGFYPEDYDSSTAEDSDANKESEEV